MKLNKGVCVGLLFTLLIGLSGCGSHQSQSNPQQKTAAANPSGSGIRNQATLCLYFSVWTRKVEGFRGCPPVSP